MNKEQSPKIYFIKNIDGQYYNAREKQFYSNFIHANYEKDLKLISSYLTLPNFADCEIETMTEHDLMEEMASKTTNCVLAGSYFAELLKELMFKLPTISQVNKTMYQKCKVSLETLTPFTSLHLEFLKRKEEDTDDVRGHYQEFIHEASKVEIFQTAEVVALLKAYQIDRKSLLGVAKKVLSHNKK